MADITMCSSRLCPRRETCYRVSAKHSLWQAWSDFFRPECQCDMFIKAKAECEETGVHWPVFNPTDNQDYCETCGKRMVDINAK